MTDTASPPEELTLVESICEGMYDEMARDDDVLVLGEDVGRSGGVFRATEGLYDEFGEQRVVDTPLSETGIVGTAIGMTMAGLKPVAEIQFMGFIYSTLEQLFTRAARLHVRSDGQFNCQLVVRVPFGAGIRAPDLHGESMEALFAHYPGLKVVAPSHPYDAKGLLISAIRDPDPVLFLEPKRLYRSVKADVPQGTYEVPLGEASTRRAGEDISVFTWGAMTQPTLSAAEDLTGEVDVEVIDLRSLSPLDRAAITTSFRKTGRALIVHEAPRTGGLGAEITSIIQENCLPSQKAPIERVTGYDIIYPLYEQEDYYLPDSDRIKAGIRDVMSFQY